MMTTIILAGKRVVGCHCDTEVTEAASAQRRQEPRVLLARDYASSLTATHRGSLDKEWGQWRSVRDDSFDELLTFAWVEF